MIRLGKRDKKDKGREGDLVLRLAQRYTGRWSDPSWDVRKILYRPRIREQGRDGSK